LYEDLMTFYPRNALNTSTVSVEEALCQVSFGLISPQDVLGPT